MRDYNAIAFRSPKKTATASDSQHQPKQQQYHQYQHEEEEKKDQMSKDSHSTEPTQRSLSPLPHHIPVTTTPTSPQPGVSSQQQHNSKSSMSSSPTRASGIPPPSSASSSSLHRSPQQQQQQQQRSSPQQQQQQQAGMSSNNNNNNSSTASANNNNNSINNSLNTSTTSSQLSAADALSVRRDGAETTIVKLRHALDDSNQKDVTSKTALAKSDAVILELRSSVRQLKRQLDRVQDERNLALEAKKAALEKLRAVAQNGNNNNNNSNNRSMTDNTNNNNNNNNADNSAAAAAAAMKHAQDLQMQLDRAHAQILTADMVRKELEDTLEAEQYTWELRVQDQERQIAELQQDCATLVNDLEAVRHQWKTSQQEKDVALQELQAKLAATQLELARYKTNNNSSSAPDQDNNNNMDHQVAELQQKLVALEQERAELQACLDEALKELEAVDAELQADPSAALRVENEALQKQLQQRQDAAAAAILEPLVHLHRLVLERDGVSAEQIQAALSPNSSKSSSKKHQPTTRDAQQVIAAIQLHLDQVSREQKSNNTSANSSSRGVGGGGVSEQDLAAMRQQVRELQAQISVYKGDLMAREESSAELRTSLKEAVSLLKPLQDAVAKADREKSRLQVRIQELQKRNVPSEAEQLERKKLRQELMDKDKEIDELRQQVDHLEVQLTKTKAMAASGLIAAHKSPSSGSVTGGAIDSSTPELGESKARAKLRAKRAEEQQLKQLLRDAQSRFKSLHQQNAEVESKNIELQGRLNAEQSSPNNNNISHDRSVMVPSIEEHQELMQTLQERERALEEVENELKVHKGELAKKTVEMRTLERDLEQARMDVAAASPNTSRSGGNDNNNNSNAAAALHEAKSRVQFLERKLNETDKELRHKRETERSLNRSLKEALNLLRPLQMHLEEAEREKRELALELQDLQSRLDGGVGNGEDDDPALDGSKAGGKKGTPASKSKDSVALHVKELEYAVRQLEKENSQLHDALEDMSHSVNAAHVSGDSNKQHAEAATARLREEFKELKKSHEVTQSRLEDMFVENHTLVEALKKREKEEEELAEEVNVLRHQLERAEAQLQQQQQGQQQQSQSQSRYKQPAPSPGNHNHHHRGQR